MNKFLKIPGAFSWRNNTLSKRERMNFMSRLSFLLNSEIPILESLQIVENQTKNKKHKVIYQEIIAKVSQGNLLSQSIKKITDDFSTNIIYTGELSGFLGPNLNYLSEHLKRKHSAIKKVQQALLYPIFVAVLSIGITVFLLTYIFPKIIPVINSLNMKLPVTTRFVIFVSGLVSSFWLETLLALIAFIFAFIFIFKKNKKFKFFIQRSFLRVPIFGKVYQNILMANFCRDLSFLLRGGLSIDKALKISSNSNSNLFLRSKIVEMNDLVCQGAKLSTFLSKESNVFPVTLSQMVIIGEKTGNLPKVFSDLADLFDEQFSEQVKNISTFIEPTLMVLVGVTVGLIAVSIITPVYEITNGLQTK